MPHQLISIDVFKQLDQKGQLPDEYALQKGFATEIKGIDINERTVDFIISTAAVDRDNDTVDVNGWDLSDYKKNPVVLFAHDYYAPPIARGINLRVEDGKLKSKAHFAGQDIYPFADTIFRLLAGGFLNATSVGFVPLEWSYVDDDSRKYGVDFKRQKLLEYSVVPVPSNPEALIEARSKGIDLKPLSFWARDKIKVAEKGKSTLIKGEDLEILCKLDKEPVHSKHNKELSMSEAEKILEAVGGLTKSVAALVKLQEDAAKKDEKPVVQDHVKEFVKQSLTEFKKEIKDEAEAAAKSAKTQEEQEAAIKQAVEETVKALTGKVAA